MTRTKTGFRYSFAFLLIALFAVAAAPPVAAGPTCFEPTVLARIGQVGLADGHIAGPGGAEYYSISVRAGEHLVVQLDHPVLPLSNWGITPVLCQEVVGGYDEWGDGFHFTVNADGSVVFVVFTQFAGGDFTLAWTIFNGP